jgi:hypothetical protein
MTLGLSPFLTEMSSRNLPRGKARSARKGDNRTAICEPIGRHRNASDVTESVCYFKRVFHDTGIFCNQRVRKGWRLLGCYAV